MNLGRISDTWKKFMAWRERHSRLLIELLDILLLFLLSELLSRFTAGSVYFQSIDVRLIFIFLIATFHGLRAGVIAAVLDCAVLVFQYHQIGIYGLQLFYNVENWIPFVLYIVTGAITGYYANLREVKFNSVERENGLQREKYLFLNELYRSSVETNEAYRKQILSFDESYGRVYDAVCRLDCPTVDEVCVQGGRVLEEMLHNSSAALYELLPGKQTAVAVSAFSALSPERQWLTGDGNRAQVLQCMAEGREWINTDLLLGAPMYAIPVEVQDGIDAARHLMTVVWDAEPEQMSEYYANRVRIFSGLVQKALEKAALTERSRGESERDMEPVSTGAAEQQG